MIILAENTTAISNNSVTVENQKRWKIIVPAKATEMNNAKITKVYCIATFTNCQEEKLDKDHAVKIGKAYTYKCKMKQA